VRVDKLRSLMLFLSALGFPILLPDPSTRVGLDKLEVKDKIRLRNEGQGPAKPWWSWDNDESKDILGGS